MWVYKTPTKCFPRHEGTHCHQKSHIIVVFINFLSENENGKKRPFTPMHIAIVISSKVKSFCLSVSLLRDLFTAFEVVAVV